MAKATEAQVKKLEAEHKKQFALLVGSAKIWQGMARKYATLPNTDPKKMALLKYGGSLKKAIISWYERQLRLQKAGIPQVLVQPAWWFYPSEMPKLEKVLREYADVKQMQGIGFIPLIIWGVIAIIGMFTAEEIVDEINTTAEEKTELLESTNKTCQDMQLTKEQCTALISQTQAEASGKGSNWLLWLLGLGGIALFVANKNKSKTAKAA